MRASMIRGYVITALAAVLVAIPATADAQGKSGKSRDGDRPELIRRGEDRKADARRGESARMGVRRGPAFCRNGQGHPVHGQRWCYDRGFGSGSGVLLDRRRDDRRGGSYGDASSYDRMHREFHLRHDRECRMRAAERPLDIQWQIRVRADCKQRHDEWHYRAGRRHG